MPTGWSTVTLKTATGNATFYAYDDGTGNLAIAHYFRSVGFAAAATFTPTAVAYSAGAVMGGAQQFANIGPVGGGEALLTSAEFEIDTSAFQSGEGGYTLHLYNVTPPSALANTAAWDLPAGDRASHLCTLAIPAPTDLGSTLKVDIDQINKQITIPSGGSLYGYLVTPNAFTATAVARKVTLHTMAV